MICWRKALPSDLEILNEASRHLENRKTIVLCTVIEKNGHGPRDVGAKMLVMEDGASFGTIGGGDFERTLVGECLKALNNHKSKTIRFNLSGEDKPDLVSTCMVCGGELSVLADVIEPEPRLIIIGSGNIAVPLAKLGQAAGFKIVVIDDEPKHSTKGQFPMAEQVIVGNYAKSLIEYKMGSGDYAVVAHGEPEHDFAATKLLLGKNLAYVGLLGSKKKIELLTERLKAEGVVEQQLATLHAPVGLDIGAETPEEIGVSVLAEIIKIKRTRSRGSVSKRVIQ